MSHQPTPAPPATRRTFSALFLNRDARLALHDPAVTARSGRPHRPSRWVAVPVALYALLVLLGVTQSSIGIAALRENPASPTGVMVGGPVAIRTDEYLTSTPLAIGVTATGNADDFNPLTAAQGFSTMFPSTPVSSVVLFDGAALRLGPVLPDQMLIAARWWLPFLLLFLGAPALFRTITGNRSVGLFAAAMIVLSPASAWWSFSPLGVLGFTIAGAAAMQRCASELAVEKRRGRAVAWGLVASVLLARTPLHYQPWAIVIAPTILLAVIVPLIVNKVDRKSNLVAVIGTGVTSIVLAALVLLENRASIKASLGTLYPGARVSSGSANPFQEIFGGTDLAWLKDAPIVGTNHSEISSSYAVAAVLVVFLVAYGVKYRDRAHRFAVLTASALLGFWFAWSMVDFGTLGSRIPILELVPSGRSADMLGYLSVFVLCLILPAAVDRPRRGFAGLAAGVAALISAYAGSLLRAQNLPDLKVRDIWLAALLLAIVVFAITYRPRWWGGYVGACLCGVLLVWHVNPVLFGLADLRGSDIAQRLMTEGKQARANHELWVSDDLHVDSLLSATGVPALSGRQLSGPDIDAWSRLDPTKASEVAWNRGGSFITYQWTASSVLTITNPAPDVIYISGSPCALAARFPELTTVVSSHELSLSCGSQIDTFTWGGSEKWVYKVTAGGVG
jgi:hypothetical protein